MLKKTNWKYSYHFCFDKVLSHKCFVMFYMLDYKINVLYSICIWIVALNTPTPPPMGGKIDESIVKPVSGNKILMVETENVKDQSYEYSDQMKVRMLT